MGRKNEDTYVNIFREIKMIKIKYCSKCVHFEDYECKKKRLYKECFRNNRRLKKESKND